jgi:hypothetical protein
MRRLIVAVMAVAAWTLSTPSTAAAQDVKAQRAERRAQMQQRLTENRAERQQRLVQRRTEMLQRLAERRPELKDKIDQRIAEGKVRPQARKLMLQRRMKMLKTLRPEMFDRLDLNKDGVLSPDEFKARAKRKV